MSYVYHTEDVFTVTDKYGQAVTDSFGVTDCYTVNPNNGGVTHVPCPAATSTLPSSSSSHSADNNNNNHKPTLVLPVALGSVLGFSVLLTIGLLVLFFRRRRRRNEEALEAEKLDHPSYSLTPFAPRQSILAETEATGVVVQGREAATTNTTAGRRRSFRREDEQGDRNEEEEQMGRMMTRELGGGGEEDDVLERKLEGWKAVAVAREDDIVGGQSQWGSRETERMKQNPFGDSNAVYSNSTSSRHPTSSSSHQPSLINTSTFSSSHRQHQSSTSPQTHLYSSNSPTNPFDSSPTTNSYSPRHTPTTSSPQAGIEGSTSHLPLLGHGVSRQQEEDAGISLMRSGGLGRRTSSEAPSIAPPAYDSEWRD